MRKLSVGLALLAAGCATSGGGGRGPDDYVGGPAGDLRVLMDDRCVYAQSLAGGPVKGLGVTGELAGVAVDVLSKIGGLTFKSFGTFLKRAGEAQVTRSVGGNGGHFYAAAAEGRVSVAPKMRCVYLARNGFGPSQSGFAKDAPVDLKETWTRLGLNQTPDLFAAMYLETSGEVQRRNSVIASFLEDFNKSAENRADGESPGLDFGSLTGPAVAASAPAPFFRVKLDRLYVREFQGPASGAGTRDMAVILNYGLASSQAAIQTQGAGAGVTELTGKFAVGGIRFAGVRKGDYRAETLIGLQTAWMPMPEPKPFDMRATTDVAAYVVEFAPGNPLLEDIGEYLAGHELEAAVQGAVTSAIQN